MISAIKIGNVHPMRNGRCLNQLPITAIKEKCNFFKATCRGIAMQRNTRLLRGLFLLRFGLGIFLLMWALDKLIAPEIALKVFSHFYFTNVSPSMIMLIGAVQLVLSLLIIFGFYKTLTYGLGLVVHTVSTCATYKELLSPFGENHLFIAAVPILFAFIALFLLRDFDTLWTLGKKKSLFT